MIPFQSALVTGGAGFIGSHIVDTLVCDGIHVTVLDDLSTGKISNISHQDEIGRRISIIRGDITDDETVTIALKDVDVVFHEAAIVRPHSGIKEEEYMNRVNVEGTLNLLRNAVNCGVERFIFASSSAVYGDTQKNPIKEDDGTWPTTPYGLGKLKAEEYCREFYENRGLKTIVLRYFNVYGPKSETGPYSGVINNFIKRLVMKEGPIINGSGSQTRGFIYVDDVVRANLLAAANHNSIGKIFNVGSGVPVSIEALADLLVELILGKKYSHSI